MKYIKKTVTNKKENTTQQTKKIAFVRILHPDEML
jgi:hypothetical protein